MSKVSQMSLRAIIHKIDIKFKFQDIKKFCFDKDTIERLQSKVSDSKGFEECLIQSEPYIDKERLVFISWLNYKEDLEEKLSTGQNYVDAEGNLKEIRRLLNETNQREKEVFNSRILSDSAKKKELRGLLSDKEELRKFEETFENMVKIKNISNDMNTFFVTIFSNKNTSSTLNIISSQEEMFGRDLSKGQKENKRICDELDEKLSGSDEENVGLNYALQCLEQEDLRYVLPKDIASAALYVIGENTRKMYEQDIEKFESQELKQEEKDKLADKIREQGIIPQTSEAIKEVLKYIDLKKLLLISIYRFEDLLEENRNR